MDRRYGEFTVYDFGKRLKQLRVYRGYKSQARICRPLNISRQVWSLWEMGKRIPSMTQASVLANIFKVDIRYFFLREAVPREFDISGTKPKEDSGARNRGLEREWMPFVTTSVTGRLFALLNECRREQGFFAVNTIPDSGVSRGLLEYRRSCFSGLWIVNNRKLLNREEVIGSPELVILNKAQRIPPGTIRQLMDDFTLFARGALILIGPDIESYLERWEILDRIHRVFSLDFLTMQDFEKIATAALPGMDREMLNSVKMVTGVRLTSLFELVRKIQTSGIHPLTREVLMKIGLGR